jgi:hypothetical protein
VTSAFTARWAHVRHALAGRSLKRRPVLLFLLMALAGVFAVAAQRAFAVRWRHCGARRRGAGRAGGGRALTQFPPFALSLPKGQLTLRRGFLRQAQDNRKHRLSPNG